MSIAKTCCHDTNAAVKTAIAIISESLPLLEGVVAVVTTFPLTSLVFIGYICILIVLCCI